MAKHVDMKGVVSFGTSIGLIWLTLIKTKQGHFFPDSGNEFPCQTTEINLRDQTQTIK